ncbi:MAG: acylphosphatase [Planctomycetota bacterium]|jgi:acylphosphatase
MSLSRYDITFTGRVQGVNFRWTTCRVAERFPVVGWVRNEPDGSVRCVVEGEPHQLDGFVKAVEEAMAGHITQTSIAREDAAGELSGFGVRY